MHCLMLFSCPVALEHDALCVAQVRISCVHLAGRCSQSRWCTPAKWRSELLACRSLSLNSGVITDLITADIFRLLVLSRSICSSHLVVSNISGVTVCGRGWLPGLLCCGMVFEDGEHPPAGIVRTCWPTHLGRQIHFAFVSEIPDD